MIHSDTSFNPDSDKKDADDFAHHSKTKNRRFEDKRRQDTKKTAELLQMHLTTYREYEQQKRRIPADFILKQPNFTMYALIMYWG